MAIGLLVAMALSAPANSALQQTRGELQTDTALAPEAIAPLDLLIAPREEEHRGKSAFRLVGNGAEALLLRARSAGLARRSLDVQTFIWRFDATGRFLAHRLVEAADRGVRVRVLVDDLDARRNNVHFAALAAHPNIAVRVFNPFSSRDGTLGFIGESLLEFDRINRRMHNKTWIADNRLAIVGGRNIGDEYFEASDTVSFVDLDFAMMGPVVREASGSFDRYWNSSLAHPIESLEREKVTEPSLAALRVDLSDAAKALSMSSYASALIAYKLENKVLEEDGSIEWTANYHFVSDDPVKALMKIQDPRGAVVRRELLHVVKQAREDLVLISPYFVPGNAVVALLRDAAGSGRRVRVLTNSLVTNDVIAVHGGYSRYRRPLLESGVELFELKPIDGDTELTRRVSTSSASLHTKALLVDQRTVFVGSYNLDPRSAWLNCEQGVLVESRALAREMSRLFARQTAGQRAWRVALVRGHLRWSDDSESFSTDPGSSLAQRLKAWLVSVLGLDAQL